MNPTENTENAFRDIRETHPKRTLPLTEALEDYENACNTDGKKSCGSSVWLCAVVLFFIIGCLAFQQRSEKPQNQAHENVQKPLNISPYLTLNVPKQPFRLADLKNDAIRDAFDTSEENFIESQTGQEFYSTIHRKPSPPNTVPLRFRTIQNSSTSGYRRSTFGTLPTKISKVTCRLTTKFFT